MLQVGDKLIVKGFSEAQWQALLDDAGYPKTPRAAAHAAAARRVRRKAAGRAQRARGGPGKRRREAGGRRLRPSLT